MKNLFGQTFTEEEEKEIEDDHIRGDNPPEDQDDEHIRDEAELEAINNPLL